MLYFIISMMLLCIILSLLALALFHTSFQAHMYQREVQKSTRLEDPSLPTTTSPSTQPTVDPTEAPTQPTLDPTKAPTAPTLDQTEAPTVPTLDPTETSTVPTLDPTEAPTVLTLDPTAFHITGSKKLDKSMRKFVAKPTKSIRKKLIKEFVIYFNEKHKLIDPQNSDGRYSIKDEYYVISPKVFKYFITGIDLLLQQLSSQGKFSNLGSACFGAIFRVLIDVSLMQPSTQLEMILHGVASKVIQMGLALCETNKVQAETVDLVILLSGWHEGSKFVKRRLRQLQDFKKVWVTIKVAAQWDVGVDNIIAAICDHKFKLRCNRCGAKDENNSFQKCGQCKLVFYCSHFCQKLAWDAHKVNCVRAK